MREHVEEPRYVTTDDDTVYSLLSKRAARTPDDIIAEWQDDNTHQHMQPVHLEDGLPVPESVYVPHDQ